MYTLVCVY